MPMDRRKGLLCGRCLVRLDVSADADDETTVHCPRCGESDTLRNATREAGQHFAHTFLSSMLMGAVSALSLPATRQAPLHYRFVEADD